MVISLLQQADSPPHAALPPESGHGRSRPSRAARDPSHLLPAVVHDDQGVVKSGTSIWSRAGDFWTLPLSWALSIEIHSGACAWPDLAEILEVVALALSSRTEITSPERTANDGCFVLRPLTVKCPCITSCAPGRASRRAHAVDDVSSGSRESGAGCRPSRRHAAPLLVVLAELRLPARRSTGDLCFSRSCRPNSDGRRVRR